MKRKAVTLQLEGEIPQPQSAYDAAVEEGYEGSEEQYGKELATIPPTQEQFDAIPGRLSKLTTTTEKSDFHHITDSAASKVADFGMEGKTEQETTEGKNLCDLQIGKCFNIYNGEIEEAVHYAMCSIEASEEMSVTISIPSTEEHGWYISYMRHNGVTTNIYNRILPGYSVSITLLEGVTMLSGDAIDSKGASLTEFKPIKVQIEPGSVATAYEPYTNGPSPNPDYPQEIVNAGVYNEATGRYEHKFWLHAKNLVDKNGWNVGYMNNSIIGEELSYKNLSIGHYQEIEIPRNTDIYIETLSKDGVSKLRFIYALADENNNVTFYKNDSFPGTWSRLNVNSSNACKLSISILDISIEDADIRVNLASNSDFDGYYQSTEFTLTSPVPLTKWDKLVKRDGVYGWSVRAKEYNLSADECTTISANNLGDTTSRMYINNIVGKKYGDCLCEIFPHHYMWHTGNFPDSGFFYGETFCIQMSNKFLEPYGYTYDESDYEASRINVVNALLELIRAHDGIRVWTDMQEEQSFHPLPDEEQELLHNLETYYGVTNLYNDQGCPMWLTYVQDTKTAVDNKFNNIKTALLSLGANI